MARATFHPDALHRRLAGLLLASAGIAACWGLAPPVHAQGASAAMPAASM